jgi:adenosine deaminase
MEPTLAIRGLTHDHIDGSMAVLDILDDLYRIAKVPKKRRRTPEQIRAFFRDTHVGIVEKFAVVTDLLQTQEALELMGYAYGKRRAKEGYRYVEGKFAPDAHLRGGLAPRTVVHAMQTGIDRASREFGIDILPQVCIGRHLTADQGLAIARIVLDYDGDLALDLACDEAGHPPEKHFKAYAYTFGSNVRRDCHAGEWVKLAPKRTYRARLLENVRTAVRDLRCHGISHAIPLADDDELVREVVDKGIRVSGCPLSNKRLNLIGDVRHLRIDELLDRGVIYTLNADDDLFLPTMPEVVAECMAAYAFTPAHCRALEENVFRGAFGR